MLELTVQNPIPLFTAVHFLVLIQFLCSDLHLVVLTRKSSEPGWSHLPSAPDPGVHRDQPRLSQWATAPVAWPALEQELAFPEGHGGPMAYMYTVEERKYG